jgi:glutaredoxin
MSDPSDSTPSRQPPAVVLYKKAGCHLCDLALDLLRAEGRRARFTLTVRDITNDPALLAEHGFEVPVVFIDGKKRFFGKVDPVMLRRALAGRKNDGPG